MDRLFQGRLQRCGCFGCHLDITTSSLCLPGLVHFTCRRFVEYIVSVNSHVWNVPKTFPSFGQHSCNRKPQLGGSHNTHFFLMVLGARSPRSRCWQPGYSWAFLSPSLLLTPQIWQMASRDLFSMKVPPGTQFHCVGIIFNSNLSLQRLWCQIPSHSSPWLSDTSPYAFMPNSVTVFRLCRLIPHCMYVVIQQQFSSFSGGHGQEGGGL